LNIQRHFFKIVATAQPAKYSAESPTHCFRLGPEHHYYKC